MKPKLRGGSTLIPNPFIKYPAVPDRAMGKPMAAEVPIAWRTGILHQIRKGTDIAPPPPPTQLETPPIRHPTMKMAKVPGSFLVGFGLISKNIWTATIKIKMLKNTLSKSDERRAAAQEPKKVPKSMPPVIRQKTNHMTTPRRWCTYALEMEAKRIAAKEVPNVICKM